MNSHLPQTMLKIRGKVSVAGLKFQLLSYAKHLMLRWRNYMKSNNRKLCTFSLAISLLICLLGLTGTSCNKKEKAYLPIKTGARYIYAATVTDDEGKTKRIPTIIPQGRGEIEVTRAPVSFDADAVFICKFAQRRTSLQVSSTEEYISFTDEDKRTVRMDLPLTVGSSFELGNSGYSFEIVNEYDYPTEDWGTLPTVVMHLNQGGKTIVKMHFTPHLFFTKIDFVSSFYGVNRMTYDLVEIRE
jgi:hypothetical protein